MTLLQFFCVRLFLCIKFWQNTYLRRFLLTWVQNGPVGFEKKNTIRKKQYACRMMIILCQWDFIEQTEKLVRLLPNTSENC